MGTKISVIRLSNPQAPFPPDNPVVGRSIREDWIDQAVRQVQASEGRRIEWYFAEQAAADEARDLFSEKSELQGRIQIFVVPPEVP